MKAHNGPRTDYQDGAAPGHSQNGRVAVTAVVGVLIGLVILAAVWFFLLDESDNDQTATTGPTDTGVELPQNPSLMMLLEEGTLYVENDGNVTMSDVEVRDAAGTVICALGVISPADRQACEEAAGAQDLIAYGTGPQGQPTESRLEP